METEKTNNMDALHVAILVVCIAVVAPIVAEGIAIMGAAIINALQPKKYDLKLTYEDGTTETKRGTQKELKEWLNNKHLRIAEIDPGN